jgi:hypothetical protein
MGIDTGMIKERLHFLGQPPEALRALRGHELYDTLGALGLTHTQYFRALGTSAQDYCAQEFGVDLNKITVERFFQSDPNAKWLFPDIVREAVLTGVQRKPAYPSLIVKDERIAGTAYDLPYVDENEAEEELRTVAEGAVIPESAIKYGDRVIRLDKLGRGVLASYEVIRRMSVDILRVHLQRIGEQLGRALDTRLAHVLMAGDGSSGTAATVVETAASGSITYADLVAAYTKLAVEHYFAPTHMLASAATFADLLTLAELKDSALFDFAKTGRPPTPLGVQLVPMAGQPDGLVTLLDAGYAAQKLTEQDLLVESDKLINQQWDRTYVTTVTGFAVVYAKARVVLDSTWT